jgi:2-hydroxychromene-2-carboxylate isomerase
MSVIVYGDFNCPYSFLASQRVDALALGGVQGVEWRAVEHDPAMSLVGVPSGPDAKRWEDELAEVASLALPAERPPGGVPQQISNTSAAVAAYAEAVSDGVAGQLRRELFAEVWLRLHNISSPNQVRKLVAALMYPPSPFGWHLTSPDIPTQIHRGPDPRLLPRWSGCTIATDGGPLTSQGHHRIRTWQQEWRAVSGGTVPALVTGDGTAVTGVAALAHLAGLTAAGA